MSNPNPTNTVSIPEIERGNVIDVLDRMAVGTFLVELQSKQPALIAGDQRDPDTRYLINITALGPFGTWPNGVGTICQGEFNGNRLSYYVPLESEILHLS